MNRTAIVTSDVRHAEFYHIRPPAGIRSVPLLTQSATILHRRDLANLIEGAVSGTVVAKRKPAIGIIDNGDPLADLAGSRGSKTKIESPEFFWICETSLTRDGRITLWLMQRQ